MKALAAALLVVIAGLSWSARAEMLALRCEGTKTTIPLPLGKEPDHLKNLSRNMGDEEEPDIPNTPKKEPSSTDVIVTDQRVYAFDVEFETGYANDAFIRFGRTTNNPKFTGFVLEGFHGEINRIAGSLEAKHLKYRKSGWLYVEIVHSLNCKKIERKF